METITSLQNETLDALCYRHYGLNSMHEAVLEANPELASEPLFLPEGTPVKMPAIEEKTNTRRLWD